MPDAIRISVVISPVPGTSRRCRCRVAMPADLPEDLEQRINRACELAAARRRLDLAGLCDLIFAALCGQADVVQVVGDADFKGDRHGD